MKSPFAALAGTKRADARRAHREAAGQRFHGSHNPRRDSSVFCSRWSAVNPGDMTGISSHIG